jgi:hypothetical protein
LVDSKSSFPTLTTDGKTSKPASDTVTTGSICEVEKIKYDKKHL